jgi:chromosome segregation ATPase
MSSTQNDKKTLINVPGETSERCLHASSELERVRQENELLKIENDDLKRQIEQWRESTKKPNNRIDTLEEIIDERDDDIDMLKKEIDGQSVSGEANAHRI